MKKLTIILLLFIAPGFFAVKAQNRTEHPKLVVGIVIDQMRYDYLYRFENMYGENGFKKLMYEGSNFTYAHYNYVPTYTGPGHTSIYTGTTPYFHGIIANNFYDRKLKKIVYCTADNTVSTVGGTDNNGMESPRRLLATTITDQLKLATNGKSKVIAISIKDRASILPGGHMPDAAYWYDPVNGNFITSSFYMKKLPAWVNDFNNMKLAQKYMSGEWDLSYPVEKYENSLPDSQPFEADVFQEGKTTFPHSFKNLPAEKKLDEIRTTPYGNQLLFDFVKKAIEKENLGGGKYTDFLAVSFSSTDYIGHEYGPNSVEVEDTYIKLDKTIAALINELDKQVGKGNYVLFLTGDHAMALNPQYLQQRNVPAEWFDPTQVKDALKDFCKEKYGKKSVVENFSNRQVFLDYDVLKKLNLKASKVEKDIVFFLRHKFPQISQMYTRSDLEKLTAYRTSPNIILNGFNPALSGDVLIELQPSDLMAHGGKEASTHGSIYNYDTHVPMIFYGWHIPRQTINKPVYTVDIAPTIADLLKIQEPNACMGIPLISGK